MDVTAYVYGAVPPLVENDCEYWAPRNAAASCWGTIEIISHADRTLIEHVVFAEQPAASVANSLKAYSAASVGRPVIVRRLSTSPGGSDPLSSM